MTTRGRITATRRAAPEPSAGRCRTHQRPSTERGTGRTRGAKDHDSRSADGLRPKLWIRTVTSTMTSSAASNRPGSSGWLTKSTASNTPMPTPATMAIRNDRIRAMRAAVRVRNRSPGPRPMVAAVVALLIGAARTMVRVARAPARVHTTVDMAFTLMPASRAASGLSADACTASPCRVRFRNQAREATTRGMTTRASTCSLRTITPPTSQVVSKGVGYAPYSSTSGSTNCRKRKSCAAPRVATKSTTRGARKRRRTTPSSSTAPSRAPTATVTAKARYQFQFQLTTRRTRRAAPRAPSSPMAKLMTLDDR